MIRSLTPRPAEAMRSLPDSVMSLSGIIGQQEAKLALMLNAVDPRCGGVLFTGEKGCGKSALARSFPGLAGKNRPFVELPLNATEDALLGSIDLEKTLATGSAARRPGLFERAAGGALYIDDVNLLSPEILALVLKGRNDFILVASMNPEEGALSSHFLDRFGMCVSMAALQGAPERIAVMKRAMGTPESDSASDVRERIRKAVRRLEGVGVPSETPDYIAGLCAGRFVAGHRGDIHLFYAARAYAALAGAGAVDKEHVDAVAPLVLAHRARRLPEPEDDTARRQRKDRSEKEEGNHPHGGEKPDSRREDGGDSGSLENNEIHGAARETVTAEEVFGVGEDFKVRRLAFRKDRMNRSVPGRRTKTGSRGKRGRHVKSILRDNGDIAVDATIRAAAPFQRARGREEMLIIRGEDLRYRQREKRMGHLVVFVVDGSGSMGAKRRMIETKGAIQSLLTDCYQKRDRVAMIVFRKDRAQIVLPPTASVEAAAKRLQEIPVGGRTPLAAGLLEAFNLVRRERIKSAERRFLVVLLTDGRANQSLRGAPGQEKIREEIRKMAELIGNLPAVDCIVVDTESRTNFIRTGLARELSTLLDADYYETDDLKADGLIAAVKGKIANDGTPRRQP